MDIALFCASGTIGQRIFREALNRGCRVTATVRDPARLAALRNSGSPRAPFISKHLVQD